MQKFNKTARLKTSSEFLEVKRRGKSVRAGAFLISFLPRGEKRIGIVTPRKAGTAVNRNRIRRVVRELFRTAKEIFPNGDCVVVALEGAGKFDNEKIRETLKRAIEKLYFKANENHG